MNLDLVLSKLGLNQDEPGPSPDQTRTEPGLNLDLVLTKLGLNQE